MDSLHTEFLSGRHDIDDNVLLNWKIIISEEEVQYTVRKLAEKINVQFKGKSIVLACILKGAAYFFTDLSKQLTIPYSCYFIEASSYHNSQTQSECLNLLSSIEPSKFVGKTVILLDELFDNGFTLSSIKEAIHQKANVPLDMIYTCTLFKKSKENVSYEPPNLFGLVVPNVWLVGCGLDDRQEKRGWPHLYACPKCPEIEKSPDDDIFDSDEAYNNLRKSITRQLEQF
jgi:hypoxanthine phosphoribosyltransferase